MKKVLLFLLLLTPSLTYSASISDFSPYVHYTLDEESGVRYDSTDTGLDLTDYNTVGYTTGALGNASDHVAASSEYFSNSSFVASANDWSASVWTNFPDVANQTIFSIRPSSGAANLIQAEHNSTADGVRIIIRNSANQTRKDYVIDGYLTNQWNHFVIARSGDTVDVYLNNSSTTVTKYTDLSLSMTNTTRNIWIGSESASSNYADGAIDELTFFNDVYLDADDVNTLYNSGIPLPYEEAAATTTESVNYDNTVFLLGIVLFTLFTFLFGFLYSIITNRKGVKS